MVGQTAFWACLVVQARLANGSDVLWCFDMNRRFSQPLAAFAGLLDVHDGLAPAGVFSVHTRR
jgi:hypothetical protein